MSDMISKVYANTLSEVDVSNHQVIVVDEGNFYADIYEQVKYWVTELHKVVYVAALDGNSQMGTFGNVLKLIPLADTFEKLTSVCMLCVKEMEDRGIAVHPGQCSAPFTKHVAGQMDADGVLISGHESFMSTCRRHHS